MNAYIIAITIMAVIYTFYMGFSDGANAVATCVATRAIKPRYAILVSCLTMLVAPTILCILLGNDQVARTVGSLIKSTAFDGISAKEGFLFLFSALIAALLWALVSITTSVPNSTSHTILGGIVGAGLASFGFGNVDWTAVGLKIILMVFLTPVLCMAVGFVFSNIFHLICRRMHRGVKKGFKVAQVFNVILLSTSISINNVQKAMGIFLLAMAVCSGQQDPSGYIEGYEFQLWTALLMSAAIMLGLLLGGYKLIYTVGKKIYRLGTLQSYVAQLSTATVAFTCSFSGIPVSTGQVVSSSIIGVGIADKISAVRWGRAKRIFATWLLTFPIAMSVSALICTILRAIFL